MRGEVFAMLARQMRVAFAAILPSGHARGAHVVAMAPRSDPARAAEAPAAAGRCWRD